MNTQLAPALTARTKRRLLIYGFVLASNASKFAPFVGMSEEEISRYKVDMEKLIGLRYLDSLEGVDLWGHASISSAALQAGNVYLEHLQAASDEGNSRAQIFKKTDEKTDEVFDESSADNLQCTPRPSEKKATYSMVTVWSSLLGRGIMILQPLEG